MDGEVIRTLPEGTRQDFLSRPAVYTALLAATLIARAMSWRISLINPDEYAFILAGREVLAGHLPYTTMFDNKPAGLSAILAIVMGIFGQTLFAVRVFGAACVLASAVLIYEIVRRLSAREIEAVSAGVFYIAFSVLFGGASTMAEIMVAPFSCLGILLFTRLLGRPNGPPAARRLIFGAGLAFGVAAWIKTVPVVPGLGVGSLIVLYGLFLARVGFVESALRGLLLVFGLALPTLLTAVVFAAAGSLDSFTYANFGFMAVYVSHSSALYMVLHLATIAVGLWPLLLLSAGGLWADAVGQRRRPNLRPLVLLPYAWLATELVASAGPLRMYEHYFLMTLPPLAILAARALARGAALFARTAVLGEAACAAAAVFIACVPIIPLLREDALHILKYPDPQRASAAAIERLLPPDDRSLLVLTYDYMADYLYTRTPLPTRVVIPPHLLDQSSLIGPDPLAPIKAALDRRPNVILVDFTYLNQTASPLQRTAVNDVLSCCYREAANLAELWRVAEGGEYHVADVRLFQRKPAAQ